MILFFCLIIVHFNYISFFIKNETLLFLSITITPTYLFLGLWSRGWDRKGLLWYHRDSDGCFS